MNIIKGLNIIRVDSNKIVRRKGESIHYFCIADCILKRNKNEEDYNNYDNVEYFSVDEILADDWEVVCSTKKL
jgi:hypothetical protein